MSETQAVTRQTLAKEALALFSQGERISEDTKRPILTVPHDETRPEWLRDLIQFAHSDGDGDAMLPDDYRYEMIYDALTLCEEAESDEDLQDRIAEIEAPIYNAELIRYLGSHGWRPGYCDEAAKEYGGDAGTLIDRIMLGYVHEAQLVAQLVRAHLDEIVAAQA